MLKDGTEIINSQVYWFKNMFVRLTSSLKGFLINMGKVGHTDGNRLNRKYRDIYIIHLLFLSYYPFIKTLVVKNESSRVRLLW